MKAAGLTVEHVIKLVLKASNDLQSIEQDCQDVKQEEAAITAKNLNAARTFQLLSNEIWKEGRKLRFYAEYGRIEDQEVIEEHNKLVESLRQKNAIVEPPSEDE